jgi:hypothetical protein
MKNISTKSLWATLVVVLMATVAHAQTLEEVIAKNLPNVTPMKPASEMMATMAQFDLATGQFPEEWAAYYYAAYTKASVSYSLEDPAQKDMLLDEADAYLAKAKELGAQNSETYVLAAMVANARLAVDGQNRWMKYGPIFNENLEKAKSLNADNPRIYYLHGTSLFFTPEQFGGGKKAALPYFEKAAPLFEKESKASLLVPYWGADNNAYFIGECNKVDEAPVKEKETKKKKGKKEDE